MSNKRSLIIAAVIAATLLVLGVILLHNKSSQQTAPTEASEVATAGTVIIDNTDKLSNILLAEQYTAVYDALASYIRNNVNKSIEHATIVGQPLIASNGNVSFMLTTDKPTSTFKVILDRSSKTGNITMSIPSHGYKKALKVFTETGD